MKLLVLTEDGSFQVVPFDADSQVVLATVESLRALAQSGATRLDLLDLPRVPAAPVVAAAAVVPASA